ncbi:hypothetical protein JL721_4729 [Aureococcus anophagefferens]|nr:hypothetical protein JL721_4729 [Aureococcus anophagefferens]
MSGGDAEAPPGPAHLRAREVLATFASDPTYGDLVHDDFDAAAFSNAVIVRDRDGAPGGEGGESHAEATVREVAARAATVEEAIEGHLDESRDKLIRSAKGLAALQRDVEAVEVAAKEVRRRTRAMARKVLVPFEACAAKTKRLRLVFEANRLLRRCQRALFALRRLREKVGALDRVEQAGGGVELRELGAAAALVGDQIASDVTVETAKATQDLAAKTKDLVEKSKLKLAAKFHGDAAARPAEALAAHYPAARRAFLALDLRVLEKLAGAASKDDGADSLAAAAAADDDIPAVDDIDPTNDGGLLPLQHLPPDADYLGAAAKDAPPRSVVALFEAQFLAVNAEHDAGRYGPPAAGAGAASALATALAAPLRPGDVRYDNLPVEAQVERCDEVVFGNRLEMALSRHHVAPTVGRSYGPCPDNPWRTFAGAPKALAGADFTPGAVARAPRPGRGPRGGGGLEPAAPAAAPRPPAAVASAPAVAGRAVEPAALMFPELEGYEAAVPSKHDVAFMVDVALKEVRAALDDEPSLAPAVLGLVGGARGAALRPRAEARPGGAVGGLQDAQGRRRRRLPRRRVGGRHGRARSRGASAVEERGEARRVAATLRRQAGDRLGALGVAGGAAALAPGLAALDGLGGRRVQRRRRRELPRRRRARGVADDGALGALDAPASPALVRALAALSGLRNGYFAALPRCGPRGLARDVSRLDDALVDYEPEALPGGGAAAAALRGAGPSSTCARARRARPAQAPPLRGAAGGRAPAPGDPPRGPRVARGRRGRPRRFAGLRPSTVWHHCLAACGHALIPLPDALHDAGDGGDDPAPPAQRSPARLADGAFDDARADADGARVDREREAWLDVLRCLDTWAQRASASGVSSLGDVDDAIHQDGEVLFDEDKAAVMGK